MLNSRLVNQAQKLASQAQQLHYLDSPPTPEAKNTQECSETENQTKKKRWFS